MLEKNKDYIEMRVSSTDCAFTQNEPTSICVDGYVYTSYVNLPDPGELYILISKEKFDQLQTENQHYHELAKKWEENCNRLLKKTGFDTVEELVNYLDSEAECDTLREAILKLKDQVKYTCDEWYSANSRNNSWKAAAECNSPKELIEKREALEKKNDAYSRALKEWKEITGYPSPSAVKTALESRASWCHAYNEIKKANEKLGDDVNSWKNVTGYSTPESYLAARLNNATPFDYTASWQQATGCDTPDKAKSHIEGLENAIRLTNKNMLREIESTIDEWQTATGCVSPEKAQYKITDLYNRIDKMKEAASIASNWMDKIVEG